MTRHNQIPYPDDTKINSDPSYGTPSQYDQAPNQGQNNWTPTSIEGSHSQYNGFANQETAGVHHGFVQKSQPGHAPYPYQYDPGSQAVPAAAAQNPVLSSQIPPAKVSPQESIAYSQQHQTPVARTQGNGACTSEGYHTSNRFFVPVHNMPKELDRVPSGSSVLETQSVVGEFGRTYHGYKEGKYMLPNDGAEQDRLDFQHAAFDLIMGGKLHLAPIENPNFVLDVGTGTGVWAIAFAEEYPTSHVTGTDLSAIQPANAPPNCMFLKDDAEEDWMFPQKFDYVHLRFVFSCFDDPPRMMRNAFASMTPGGWIEYQDPSMAQMGSADGTVSGTAFHRWGTSLIRGAAAAIGRDIEVAVHYARWLREAGFVDVVERRMMWPVSPWSDDRRMREAGRWMQMNFMDGAFLATWKMMRASGLSEDETRDVMDAAKKELQDKKTKFYLVAYVVYGRKPYDIEIPRSTGVRT